VVNYFLRPATVWIRIAEPSKPTLDGSLLQAFGPELQPLELSPIASAGKDFEVLGNSAQIRHSVPVS